MFTLHLNQSKKLEFLVIGSIIAVIMNTTSIFNELHEKGKVILITSRGLAMFFIYLVKRVVSLIDAKPFSNFSFSFASLSATNLSQSSYHCAVVPAVIPVAIDTITV